MSKLTNSLKAITANAKEKTEAIQEQIQMSQLEREIKTAELKRDGLL